MISKKYLTREEIFNVLRTSQCHSLLHIVYTSMFTFNERFRDTFPFSSFSCERQFCGNSFQMTFPPRAISRRECFSFLSRLITETFRKIHALLEERRNSFGFNAPCLRELAPSGASIEQHASLEKRARSLTDAQSEIAAKFYESGRFS